jgi:predicted anti-sigma-YlaC factor YlaD
MKCHDFQELISAYVDGELSQTQRDFVEEHLQHCCGCQLTLAEYTRISNQMSSLRSTPPLPDIKEEIMSKTTPENVINKPRRFCTFAVMIYFFFIIYHIIPRDGLGISKIALIHFLLHFHLINSLFTSEKLFTKFNGF